MALKTASTSLHWPLIFTPNGYSAQELFNVISTSNFGFDQLILERVGGKEWVHISVQPKERNDDFSISD